jgi:hypothetical protein
MNNVRLWEEGGRRRGGWHFTGERRGGRAVAVDLYQRGPGTRQHVDLRSTDRPVFMAVSGRGRVSVGAPHSLARQPRVGGAALCIIGLVFQHAATALHPHSRRLLSLLPA